MTAIFERLTSLAEEAIGRLRVSSALNPCLWLCAIAVPFGLVCAYFSTGALQVAGLALTFAPVVLFAIAFLYFMVKDPDKLRSEDYELRKMALEIIEEKGGRLPLSATSVDAIANPYYRALPPASTPDDREPEE
jgi:hypothetical protein